MAQLQLRSTERTWDTTTLKKWDKAGDTGKIMYVYQDRYLVIIHMDIPSRNNPN